MAECPKKLSEELEDVIHLLRQASLEDEEVQEIVNISQRVPLEPPKTFTPMDHGKALATDLLEFYNFLAPTKYCQLTHVHSITSRMLGHAEFLYQSIAKKRYPVPNHLGAKKVAQHSKKISTGVCSSVSMCRKVQRNESKRVGQLRKAANIEGDVEHDSDQHPDWSTEEVCWHPFLLALLLPPMFNFEKSKY